MHLYLTMKNILNVRLSSLGLVHELSSIIAAMSPIPWGGIEWDECKILPGAFLHAQKCMINVLLRHDQSVSGIAFSPLLFTVTKTMTRMRFTYFSAQ